MTSYSNDSVGLSRIHSLSETLIRVTELVNQLQDYWDRDQQPPRELFQEFKFLEGEIFQLLTDRKYRG